MKSMQPKAAFLLLATGLALPACGGATGPEELGRPVDEAAVVQLADALDLESPVEVTLRGEVQEVCTSAGCWFVLRERRGDNLNELRVDLLATDIRLDQSARGREVVVRGELSGEDPDRKLRAVGLRLE